MLLFCGVLGAQAAPLSRPQIDEGIFARIGAEDSAAFEEFFHLTERTIYAFALSIIKNHQDACDILQDTYLKIRAAAHLYRPQGKPWAWIFTITRNLALNLLRERGKSAAAPAMENSLEFSYVSDPEDRLVLLTVLDTLEEEEREILLLHAVSGFKHREIAQSIGLPLSTVLSKYNRALKKLKKQLEQREVTGA
jgi:RNA polymerase sigma factor (sigma-70 family)